MSTPPITLMASVTESSSLTYCVIEEDIGLACGNKVLTTATIWTNGRLN